MCSRLAPCPPRCAAGGGPLAQPRRIRLHQRCHRANFCCVSPPGTAIPSHGGRSSATSVVEPPERTRGYICPPCSAVAWSGCCGAGAGLGGLLRDKRCLIDPYGDGEGWGWLPSSALDVSFLLPPLLAPYLSFPSSVFSSLRFVFIPPAPLQMILVPPSPSPRGDVSWPRICGGPVANTPAESGMACALFAELRDKRDRGQPVRETRNLCSERR